MMLRALVTIGAVQVVTMLVLVVRTKTLAVMLGPEFVGAMAVIDKLLAVIAQTASLSLPFAAARFLPQRWVAGPEEFLALFTRMRNVVLTLILVATVGTLLITAIRPELWGEALLPYRDALTMAIFGLPVIGLIPFLQNAIAGRLRQNLSMVTGLLHAIVLAVSVAGIWSGGLAGYYAVYAVLGLILAAVVARLATSGTGTLEPRDTQPWWFKLRLPTPIWRFSGALVILTFLSPYAALYVHYRLLSGYGADTAGWMQAAVGISLAVRAVLGSAHAVYLTPNVNRGGSPEERMEWANRYQLTLCLLGGVAVPPLLLFPDLVVHILYSSAFLPGAPFVVLFVLAEIVGLLSGTYQSLVVALDKMRFHVANNLVAQLLVVIGAYLLVEPLGILGTGLAVLLAPVFLYVATLAFLYHAFRLKMPRNVVLRSAWLLACLVAAGLVGARLDGLALETLLVKGVIYLVVVSGFALLTTDHERLRVREMREQLRKRWK
jgi:O-antigen/teichoic acid export membrane protein